MRFNRFQGLMRDRRKKYYTLILFLRSNVVWYYRPKRYGPVLVAQEGSALRANTMTTALWHDQNRTIPFGLIVLVMQEGGAL